MLQRQKIALSTAGAFFVLGSIVLSSSQTLTGYTLGGILMSLGVFVSIWLAFFSHSYQQLQHSE
jgi:hypothetical protein